MLAKILLLVLILLLLIMVGVILFDSNRFVIRKITVESEKVSRDYDFWFISDLHNKSYGKNNVRLFEAIDKEKVDGCFITGDIMTAVVNKDYSNALFFLNELSKRMKVFYSLGNHEYRAKIYPDTFGSMYDDYSKKVTSMGIDLLDNEKIEFENLDIYGLSIKKNYYKRFKKIEMNSSYINSEIGDVNNNRFSVLLAHNPEFFETYSKWGADLTLSGHVHGGIVRLPFLGGVVSPKLTLFPKYDGGVFKEGNSEMILSRGLGAHSIPIRLFNPAELILIHIEKKK